MWLDSVDTIMIPNIYYSKYIDINCIGASLSKMLERQKK